MHQFEAYTPFWRILNRVLAFVCAAVILISGMALVTQTFSSDGLISDSVDLPTAVDYEQPMMRIGLVYGSSVKSSYSFTAQGELTYGYNLREKGEVSPIGSLPAGNYKVNNASGYTVTITHFEAMDVNPDSFQAVYQKAVEVLGGYGKPVFPMLTEAGVAVCIGVYSGETEANEYADYLYSDLGMQGKDPDIPDDDLTDGTEDGTVEETPALYLEFDSYAFSSGNSLVMYDSNTVPVYATDVGYTYEKKMAVWCDFEKGEYLKVSTNVYESPFEFSRYKSGNTNGVAVVTVLPLETYVMGVLSEELYTSWDKEVQKAFAVIVRSYTVTGLHRHNTYGFGLCTTTHCQVYKGCRKINDNIRNAVQETRGVVLTDNGTVASVNYATVGGGVTVNCEESWQSPRTYLKAVPTPWERYKDYGNLTIGGEWHVEYTGKQLYERLSPYYSQLDSEIVDVNIDRFCTNSSYLYQLTFTDANGNTATIKKADTIRNRLGLNSGNFVIGKAGQKVTYPVYELDCYPSVYNPNRTMGSYYKVSNVTFASVWSGGSTLVSGVQSVVYPDGDRSHDLDSDETEIVMPNGSFRVNEEGLPDILNAETVVYYETVTLNSTSATGNVFVIEGKGYGHGIGICQYGAWDLARAGYDYLTILRYYFKNVTFGLVSDFLN